MYDEIIDNFKNRSLKYFIVIIGTLPSILVLLLSLLFSFKLERVIIVFLIVLCAGFYLAYVLAVLKFIKEKVRYKYLIPFKNNIKVISREIKKKDIETLIMLCAKYKIDTRTKLQEALNSFRVRAPIIIKNTFNIIPLLALALSFYAIFKESSIENEIDILFFIIFMFLAIYLIWGLLSFLDNVFTGKYNLEYRVLNSLSEIYFSDKYISEIKKEQKKMPADSKN